jgi:hypothetical protein
MMVNAGLIVSVLEEKDGWTHVSFAQDGLTHDGWISSDMLKKTWAQRLEMAAWIKALEKKYSPISYFLNTPSKTMSLT